MLDGTRSSKLKASLVGGGGGGAHVKMMNTVQVEVKSLTHLIPWPGPHTILVAITLRDPDTIDMQSSPAPSCRLVLC